MIESKQTEAQTSEAQFIAAIQVQQERISALENQLTRMIQSQQYSGIEKIPALSSHQNLNALMVRMLVPSYSHWRRYIHFMASMMNTRLTWQLLILEGQH